MVLICSPLGMVDVLLDSLRKWKWCWALWKRPAVFLYFFLSVSSLSLELVVSSEAVSGCADCDVGRDELYMG